MEQAEMERVWNDHNAAEFAMKDAEAALNTMVERPVREGDGQRGGRPG
jgi:hypothetical protein